MDNEIKVIILFVVDILMLDLFKFMFLLKDELRNEILLVEEEDLFDFKKKG